ncbi:TetR/AcrR family transcriptional regulator [Massilia aquatica]|uniref:TetR/AcrR family transcriptional regulator n=1 Tax=Massilia aquatica TaxID=2609000 RepID=A0ABX0MMC5_9BURK|nr:TetR/AcrR family transcriptional regulator [Massilia aquatica]NHZ44926.1 TetR/AcrR family transcriptional regulator [Massilia aquatica]
MTRARGRPLQGTGVSRDHIVNAALQLLSQGGGKTLTMRSIATQLNVSPMGLYNHFSDRAELLVALAERVYSDVLDAGSASTNPLAEVQALLTRYHDAVSRYPQLTLEIFAEPKAFSGVVRLITDRLSALLAALTPEHVLWRDILIDHAHGSGLALISVRDNPEQTILLRDQYRTALDRLSGCLQG